MTERDARDLSLGGSEPHKADCDKYSGKRDNMDEQQTVSPDPSTGSGQTDYKRSLAYKRLGLNPAEVETVPFLGVNLRRIARLINRGAEPGERVRPLDYLQASDDPDARKVSGVYRSVPESYRRLLPPEAFCQAAGVSPEKVLQAITVVAVLRGSRASAVVAASMHPAVVDKTVQRALEDDGTAERMMIHKALGLLPTWGWKSLA